MSFLWNTKASRQIFTDKKLKEVLRVSFANLRSEEQGKSRLENSVRVFLYHCLSKNMENFCQKLTIYRFDEEIFNPACVMCAVVVQNDAQPRSSSCT